MFWFLVIAAVTCLYLLLNAPQVFVLLLLLSSIILSLLPNKAPEPVYDSSVRGPRDYSPLLLIIPVLILVVALISGITQRWF